MSVRRVFTITIGAMLLVGIVAIGPRLFDRRPRTASATLNATAGRLFEGRLSLDGPYRGYTATPYIPPVETSVRELIQRADSAGAQLEDVFIGSAVEAALGNYVSASSRLGETARRNPRSYQAWLDLSAVLLAQANRDVDAAGQLLTASIDAALHATAIDAADPRAWFNAGLAFERFGMTAASIEALRAALANEHDRAWAAEIQHRLDALDASNHRAKWDAVRRAIIDPAVPVDRALLSGIMADYRQPIRELIEDQLLPQWAGQFMAHDAAAAALTLTRAETLAEVLRSTGADPLCAETIEEIRKASDQAEFARAFQNYGQAQRLYEASDRETTLAVINQSIAAFDRAQSVFVDRAQVRRASTLFQLAHYDEAEKLALVVEQRSASNRRPSVQAAAAWLAGIAQTQRGSADEALLSYDRAAVVLQKIGERQDLAGVQTSVANLLRITGDLANGWRHLTAATRLLDDVHSARRRQTMLLNASLFAADQDRLFAAVEFEKGALRAAQDRGVANTIVDAYMRLGRLRLRTGDRTGAAQDLQAAVDGASAIGSQSAKSYVESWLALAAGEAELTRSPARALEDLERAKKLFAAVEPVELPNVYLVTSRARLALRDVEGAERELRKGIEIVTTRREQIRDAVLQTAYQDATWDLFDRAIDLSVERGAVAEAFKLSEASRHLLYGRQAQRPDLTTEELARELPASATVVYFVSTRDRLLIWSISTRGVRFAVRPIGRDELTARVNRYRAAIQSDATDAGTLSTALYQQLLADAIRDAQPGALILVVPDAALHRLPFVSLRAQDDRFLIESHRVATMPSAAVLLSSARAPDNRSHDAPIVIVGSSRVPGLPALPEVLDEVGHIAALYPHARSLTGTDATFRQTRQALAGAAALHFAGHAQANIAVPWQSRLFFVPDATLPSGVVTAEMLLKEKLDGLQLAVFSACDTGEGPVLRGTGVSSLASTMLLQGVPSVVASLWAVEDRPQQKLLTSFHAAYAKGASATTALRDAQLALLRSGDPSLSQPRYWSGVTIASTR